MGEACGDTKDTPRNVYGIHDIRAANMRIGKTCNQGKHEYETHAWKREKGGGGEIWGGDTAGNIGKPNTFWCKNME